MVDQNIDTHKYYMKNHKCCLDLHVSLCNMLNQNDKNVYGLYQRLTCHF